MRLTLLDGSELKKVSVRRPEKYGAIKRELRREIPAKYAKEMKIRRDEKRTFESDAAPNSEPPPKPRLSKAGESMRSLP